MPEIRPVRTRSEKHRFLTFPWQIYKHDPLWVPPLLPEREKATDPRRGLFFKSGYADFFIAWEHGKPVGTICCAEETNGERGFGLIGFFECIEDYGVAQAMFQHAEAWAKAHHLTSLNATYNLDREDGRGVLIEGRDRPPAILCGHTPAYYASYFERYGFIRRHDDGLAYAIDIDPASAAIQRLARLADRVKQRKAFTIRNVDMANVAGEIDHIWQLQNRPLEHLAGFVPYSREAIEAMVLPLKALADPELVLFANLGDQTIGWFPAIPNYNEVLIHLNGLRYPWDYLRAWRYRNFHPESLSIKSVAVLPEYWDTGVAILLFAEMARRAISKGYRWADLSLTGTDNPDTWDLAHHTGAKIYKRYRFYQKEVAAERY